MQAPYVQESHVRIGLEFVEKIPIPLNGTLLMIGQVKEIFFPKDCWLKDGFLDIEKAGSITTSSLDTYHHTQKIARLSYAKADRLIKEI